MVPLLEVERVSKRFGGVQALSEVDLRGEAGEAVGLIGPNGAGKSTLVGCITGMNAIDAGTIRFCGTTIDGLPPHRRARLGIARTFQKLRLSEHLTVFENVAAGLVSPWFRAHSLRSWLALLRSLDSPAIAGPVLEALAVAGIEGLRTERVSALPFGKRHFVELTRALVAKPRVLLLDEPATGLTDPERDRLVALVKSFRAGGGAVVLIEHDLKLVGRLCDRVTVLDHGRSIFAGTPAEAQRDPDVIAAYLGTSTLARKRARDLGQPARD